MGASHRRTVLSREQVQSVRRLVSVAVACVRLHGHVVVGERLQVDQRDSVGGCVHQRRVGLVLVQDLVVLDHPVGFLGGRPGQRGGGGTGVVHGEVLGGGVGL